MTPLAPNRSAWLQVARGSATVNGVALVAGDGLAIEQEDKLAIAGEGELLLFDLPA